MRFASNRLAELGEFWWPSRKVHHAWRSLVPSCDLGRQRRFVERCRSLAPRLPGRDPAIQRQPRAAHVWLHHGMVECCRTGALPRVHHFHHAAVRGHRRGPGCRPLSLPKGRVLGKCPRCPPFLEQPDEPMLLHAPCPRGVTPPFTYSVCGHHKGFTPAAQIHKRNREHPAVRRIWPRMQRKAKTGRSAAHGRGWHHARQPSRPVGIPCPIEV